MIAFIGSIDSLYILAAIREETEYRNLSDNILNPSCLTDYLLKDDYRHYVIDLDFLVYEPGILIRTLIKIKQASTVPITFFACGFSLDSTLIKGLRNSGFRKFILADTIGEMKRQLSDCLNGNDNVEQLDRLERAKDTKATEETEHTVSSKPYKTIGICGTQSRIGTTTQAIQLVKYFQFCGYRACYIQANDHKHIQSIPTLYKVEEHDESFGKVSFENTDFYYDLYRISEVLSLDYQVFVYDFGVLRQENTCSFLEKDLKILVGGTLPWEIDHVNKAIEVLDNKDVQYLFNFTSRAIRNDLIRFMQEKAASTFFCELTANMFCLNAADRAMHEQLKNMLNPAPVKPEKRKLFQKGKGLL